MSSELLLSDYAGHPFTVELARALHERDVGVTYSYCAAVSSPKGALDGSVPIVALCPTSTFEKYRPWKRLISELRYGMAIGRTCWKVRPRQHVVCNMPVISALVAWCMSVPLRNQLVVWFQDVQSGIASSSLERRWMASLFSALETMLLRRGKVVICISDALADEARRRGVPESRISVLPNWAPIEDIPMVDRDNEWARSHFSSPGVRFIYSGTLARKHDPSLLIELARTIAELDGTLVVASEGEGAEWIRSQQAAMAGLDNLKVLPYQPFEQLPEVLGAADVLVVILESDAGRFSVPSKTLSYLCAGRAILGSIPLDNDAARLVAERADAGIVVSPHDRQAFLDAAHALAADDGLRLRLGANGRAYAEAHFGESEVVEQCLAAFAGRATAHRL